jgi:hypothetical protein
MAIDTRDKRASAASAAIPWRMLLPLADASIDAGDREQVGRSYRLVAAAVTPFGPLDAYPDPFGASISGRVDPFRATSRLRGS